MSRPRYLLLQWLIFMGVVGYVLFLVAYHGLFDTLVAYDNSRISLGILIIFAVSSLHAMTRIAVLSREISATRTLATRLAASDAGLSLHGQTVQHDGQALPQALVTRHLGLLLARAQRHHGDARQDVLLEALESRVRGGHDIGWLIADLMFKLGLLGTVIGFILMLGSVNVATDLNVTAMQGMLADMSNGMRVALFTTITGLVSGILLSMQYHLVDRGADELLASIAELADLHVAGQRAAS